MFFLEVEIQVPQPTRCNFSGLKQLRNAIFSVDF